MRFFSFLAVLAAELTAFFGRAITSSVLALAG
jgi:hypothetical protein